MSSSTIDKKIENFEPIFEQNANVKFVPIFKIKDYLFLYESKELTQIVWNLFAVVNVPSVGVLTMLLIKTCTERLEIFISQSGFLISLVIKGITAIKTEHTVWKSINNLTENQCQIYWAILFDSLKCLTSRGWVVKPSSGVRAIHEFRIRWGCSRWEMQVF